MAWLRHASLTNFIIQQSRSFQGVGVPFRLMNCLFPVHNTSHSQLSTYGDRAFPVAAVRIWNSLPQHIPSVPSLPVFCSRLKTLYLNSVTGNYCCSARKMSLMDTLIALTYLLTYLLIASYSHDVTGLVAVTHSVHQSSRLSTLHYYAAHASVRLSVHVCLSVPCPPITRARNTIQRSKLPRQE